MQNQPHSYDISQFFNLDLLRLHKLNPSFYPYLLESVAQGKHGRFDILMASPQQSLVLTPQGKTLYQTHSAFTHTDVAHPSSSDFLDELNLWFQQESGTAKTASPSNLPFIGGWFVYLGYELAQQIEPSLNLPRATGELPVAFATRVPAAVVKDHKSKTLTLVIEPQLESLYGGSIEQCRSVIMDHLRQCGDGADWSAQVSLRQLVEEDPQHYLDNVARIKQYIREGDVFQVNLSRRWDATVELSSHLSKNGHEEHENYLQLYRQLRQHNPAPFSGLVKFNNNVILSSSPERLVRVSGECIETRPIAGTRPTSIDQEDDQQFRSELMAHPKERAEHVMLIDLERNDLGRVCRPGSIEVDELMVLESYAHVHHIVSNVKGRLRSGTLPAEVIKAVFPGGTITGCPKVRCMEIIAELERQARGPYTGSFGYLNRDGSMDLNILIRTMTLENGRLSLRAGAGIVADSEPQKELMETRAKARGLLLALGDLA